MLPGPIDGAARLADVLSDSLRAVEPGLVEGPGRLGLARVDRAAVIVVDGLGADNLRARSGHARTLAAAMATRADVIATGAPSTTAAALTTITTGAHAGEHGIVGYTALEPERGRVVNQLHGFDDGELPPTWLRRATLFSRASGAGLGAAVIGAPRYADSGFTRQVLAGARYVPAARIEDRLDALGALLADRSWRGIAYCYLAELDMAGHDRGAASEDWSDALERVDAAVGALASGLDRRSGVLLTADHGMLDIPEHGRLVVPDSLWSGVAAIAGEHRLLHLHLAPGVDPEVVAARWLDAEGERAWVATRSAAIDAGWFGPIVDEEVLPRIGDVLIAARRLVAYYTAEARAGSAGAMVGQHGSWTPEEQRVPLLRFGAFA